MSISEARNMFRFVWVIVVFLEFTKPCNTHSLSLSLSDALCQKYHFVLLSATLGLLNVVNACMHRRLVFAEITENNSGIYICKASNRGASITSNQTLHVQGRPNHLF